MTEKTAKEKTISTQYAELNRFGQNGEYERALKAANKILGVAPQEFLAFHCKIVCLIELQRFDEGISLINKNPQFAQDLIFEKAYCYYRVNKHDDALKTIDQKENADLRTKELKAQILYRIEQFPQAANLYQEIIKNSNDDYDDERQTNLSAVLVYLGSSEDHDTESLGDSTYELCYNKACLLIESGNYAEAEKKLRQCEKLCRESLEEDETSEEEIDLELALIRIQLAFVFQKQGRIKEAQQSYTSNLKLKLEDIALTAVASNNIVCINKDQNLFDSKKKMKVALNDSLAFKLPSKQRKFIALNNAIFNYYINQTEQCEKCCQQINNTWPELSLYTTVLSALNLVKAEKSAEAIKLLEELSGKNIKREDKLFVKLCIAQLHLMKGDKLKACKTLENLGEDSYRPAIVGALTTLYLGLGDEETALKVFEKTVDWYKKNKIKGVDLSGLWRQAADFHIKNGHPQVAANSLEELLRANKDDKKIVAQLILACTQFDKKRALELSKNLPSVKELSVGVDVDNLQVLQSGLSNLKKGPVVKSDSQPGTPHMEESSSRKKKHKTRKGKLPKNYDPKVQPDPERWLPKYERTGFRKKRDRRTKDVIKGSQGTASGQAEQYDFSKYVDDSSLSPASNVEPSPKVKGTQQQPHQKNKGQQKRKNKRR